MPKGKGRKIRKDEYVDKEMFGGDNRIHRKNKEKDLI